MINIGQCDDCKEFDVNVDIYGESKALALSLMGDIKDIVDGRIVSIGCEFPTFSVLDLRAATPSELLFVGLRMCVLLGNGFIRSRLRSIGGSYRDWETDRKSTRLNSSHSGESRMPSSA